MTDAPTIASPPTSADTSGTATGGEDHAFLVVYPEGEAEHTGPDSRSKVVSLPEGLEVVFGRSRDATVQLDHEKVSRAHARVLRKGASIVVEDLGSRNGTKVNGKRITGPTRVGAGDEIGVGIATAIVGLSSGLRRQTFIGGTSDLDERLAAEADRAARYRRPLALLLISLQGAEGATLAATDRLAATLRRMDVIAEESADEIAIILPEADITAARAAASRLAGEARAAGLVHGGVAVKVGVATFPSDGTQPGELLSRARAALRRAMSEPSGVAGAPIEKAPDEGDVVAVDPQTRRVFALLDKVAPTPITVLLHGETGVGKEVLAAAVHQRSPRAKGPFVRLNCAALPETLLEAELFGHEKGAFTGADKKKPGFFEVASGGTLFLDELGELPLALQPKLLRALEQRTITRVGGTAELPIDVRLVCASNRDLETEVGRGRFREDLYFRVSAFVVLIPPLRDRKADIQPLADRFLRKAAKELGVTAPRLGDEALRLLLGHSWPGNVRELRNAIERAVVLAPGGVIEAEHLPPRILDAAAPRGPEASGTGGAVRDQLMEVERRAIVAALEECGGNQTRAAQKLGLSRRALIYKLEKHGLKAPPAR